MNATATASQLTRKEAVLTAKGRKHIKKKNFALPGGRYPIHDKSHARNALARVAQHGTPDEKARVRKAVHAKFPGIGESQRIQESGTTRISETARILEAVSNDVTGEKIFKVVLITEGLGNKRNMNYYGPEAIASAVKAYEGRFCYLNHNSESGERDLPERRIQDKAGYYKNLKETKIDGSNAVVGELHCDLSESGQLLADKMASALHYKKEFPNGLYDYVGLSVNGDGNAEKRTMSINGIDTDVNYVKEFLEGDSCDCVTTPARGGRGLAVLQEDARGARVSIMNREDTMKLLDNLKKMLAKINESSKEVTGDVKKRLEESKKMLSDSIKSIESEDESSEAEAMFARREDESEADHKARLEAMQDMIAKHLDSSDEDEADETDEADEDGEDEDNDDTPPAKQAESSRKQAKISADDLERNKIAIRHLMQESGIPERAYSEAKVEQLARMSFREARMLIDNDARLAKSIVESAYPVASHRGGFHVETRKDSNTIFKEAFCRGR